MVIITLYSCSTPRHLASQLHGQDWCTQWLCQLHVHPFGDVCASTSLLLVNFHWHIRPTDDADVATL